MKAKDFLTKDECTRLIEAIDRAERETSGEIRIHIESHCEDDPKERALRTFRILNMSRTAERNGVLIYVASLSHKFAVIGDRGINAKVPAGFWKDVAAVIGENFSKGLYAEGLGEAVEMTGRKLKAYFPYSKDDVNELPNDISFNDDDAEDDAKV
jgi:uncharacterized membrane protein